LQIVLILLGIASTTTNHDVSTFCQCLLNERIGNAIPHTITARLVVQQFPKNNSNNNDNHPSQMQPKKRGWFGQCESVRQYKRRKEWLKGWRNASEMLHEACMKAHELLLGWQVTRIVCSGVNKVYQADGFEGGGTI
jgi:ribosome modulation factor